MTRRPLYLDREPRGLVARLFNCFQLTDDCWVCYARKESPPMTPEFTPEEAMVELRAALRQASLDLRDLAAAAEARRAQIECICELMEKVRP